MKIEPRTLNVLRKYLLKKHTPIIDLMHGVTWVAARPQDGALFMVGFNTPNAYTGLLNDYLCVAPDAVQSEFEIEEQFEGYHLRRTRLKIRNGAEYPIAPSGNRLEAVNRMQLDLAYSLYAELLPPFQGRASHDVIPDRALRFAAQVSARLEKICGNRVLEWKTSWRETNGDGFVFVKKSDCGDFFCVGKRY